MTDRKKDTEDRSGRWVAAAGIGSAALVAALLYAKGKRTPEKPKPILPADLPETD